MGTKKKIPQIETSKNEGLNQKASGYVRNYDLMRDILQWLLPWDVEDALKHLKNLIVCTIRSRSRADLAAATAR